MIGLSASAKTFIHLLSGSQTSKKQHPDQKMSGKAMPGGSTKEKLLYSEFECSSNGIQNLSL